MKRIAKAFSGVDQSINVLVMEVESARRVRREDDAEAAEVRDGIACVPARVLESCTNAVIRLHGDPDIEIIDAVVEIARNATAQNGPETAAAFARQLVALTREKNVLPQK